MQRIIFMIKGFLQEPLWFKLLISLTFLASVVLSSSFFSHNDYLQGYSKLAASIFFLAYGVKIRRSFGKAFILFGCSALCIYLFISSLLMPE